MIDGKETEAQHGIEVRFNLGCGSKRIAGYVGVDKFPGDGVDLVHDLETLPWPWADDSVDEIVMWHVLEHLGESTKAYLGIIKELYRICRDQAKIHIRVPHPRHSDFLNDPTHVRPITPEGLILFSKRRNLENKAAGYADSPLALYLGVDFELVRSEMAVEPAWANNPDLEIAARTYNDVVKAIGIELKCLK